MVEKLISIGEVAEKGGVSVQTLRHYDKIGLLTPAKITEAGYRLYSVHECLRLELIRTLRGVGFALDTIGQLLKDKRSVRDAVALQLELLEAQVCTLQRQRVLLKAVLNGQESAMLPRLRRLDVLARLSKLEREAFLAAQLGWNPRELWGSPKVWEAAIFNLPEEMNEVQIEAWLELAELAADKSFQQTLHWQGQPFVGIDDAHMHTWTQTFQTFMSRAARAIGDHECANGEAAQDIVKGWVEALADVLKKTPDSKFAKWMLEYYEATSDPRFERYWQLVAVLKGWAYTGTHAQVTDWLLEGLRARVRV